MLMGIKIKLRGCLLCFLINVLNYESTFGKEKIVTPQYLQTLLTSSRYDEFSKLLQIPDVGLVDPAQRSELISDLIFYSGLPLGDVLLRPSQKAQAFQHAHDYAHLHLPVKLWKNGVVPYFIARDQYSAENITAILSAVEDMNAVLAPNVLYRPYQDGDEDYVFFFPGGKGCYSNVGCVGGPQAISMSDPCIFYHAVILHEFQHALGLLHETDRIDRDDYLRVLYDNIPKNITYQYYKYGPRSFINEEPFDYSSIMFYPSVVPGNYNITIFEPTQKGVVLNPTGAFPALSPTDIKRVKKLYKAKLR